MWWWVYTTALFLTALKLGWPLTPSVPLCLLAAWRVSGCQGDVHSVLCASIAPHKASPGEIRAPRPPASPCTEAGHSPPPGSHPVASSFTQLPVGAWRIALCLILAFSGTPMHGLTLKVAPRAGVANEYLLLTLAHLLQVGQQALKASSGPTCVLVEEVGH